MTSPGLRLKIVEQYSINCGIGRISIEVSDDCTTIPLTRVSILSFVGLPISSGVTRPGSERTGADKILARGNLLRMPLPVAHAHIVVDRIAGNMRLGIRLADVATCLSDHNRQLAFPVELVRDFRSDDRLVDFVAACIIVTSDEIRKRRMMRQSLAKIDDGLPDDRASAFPPALGERQQLHGSTLLAIIPRLREALGHHDVQLFRKCHQPGPRPLCERDTGS